jgi:hypothetical protein
VSVLNFHPEIDSANTLQLVSEVGFMMEDETRQFLIGLFRELKTKMNAGQEEMKADISASETNVKDDISAVKNYISAVKDEVMP